MQRIGTGARRVESRGESERGVGTVAVVSNLVQCGSGGERRQQDVEFRKWAFRGCRCAKEGIG